MEFMEHFQHQIMYVLFWKDQIYTKELSKFLIPKGAFEDVSENSAWNGKNLVALSNPQDLFLIHHTKIWALVSRPVIK